MQRDKDGMFTIAALLILAGLIISQFIFAGREQARHEAEMQKIAAAEAVQREKQAIIDQENEKRRLQENAQRQAAEFNARRQDFRRRDITHKIPTAAQRAAAEEFYKNYLDADTSKVVSRQMPQKIPLDTLQGFNMNKWVHFRDDGATATLVGMGEAYVDIKPEDLSTMNYTYYSQGRLGTMIVVNFQTGNDPVFAGCRESFAEGFPPQKLLTVFGYGVTERVMHDGLNDEVILNIGPLTQCALADNYQ
jgi:hypothetical protein